MARKVEAPLAQIADYFELWVTTLKRWLVVADRKETGVARAAGNSAEMRDLKKRNLLVE